MSTTNTTPTPRKATRAATATKEATVTALVQPQTAPEMSVRATFTLPADTKNFARFAKESDPDGAFVNTQYLASQVAKRWGNPNRIEVIIRPLADDED